MFKWRWLLHWFLWPEVSNGWMSQRLFDGVVSASDIMPTDCWQNGKHFGNFEVVIWLVEFYTVSERLVCRDSKPFHRRTKPLCLQLWQWSHDLMTLLNDSFISCTPVCYCRNMTLHFHIPKHDAEQNKVWLAALHVYQMASWAVLGQWKLWWRSGCARL